VAVDGAGDIYLAGSIELTSRVGPVLPGGPASVNDAFLRKYDAHGQELWTWQFGTGGLDAAQGVAAGAEGDIYVVGFTGLSLLGQPHQGEIDAFVLKLEQRQ